MKLMKGFFSVAYENRGDTPTGDNSNHDVDAKTKIFGGKNVSIKQQN